MGVPLPGPLVRNWYRYSPRDPLVGCWSTVGARVGKAEVDASSSKHAQLQINKPLGQRGGNLANFSSNF